MKISRSSLGVELLIFVMLHEPKFSGGLKVVRFLDIGKLKAIQALWATADWGIPRFLREFALSASSNKARFSPLSRDSIELSTIKSKGSRITPLIQYP